MGKAISVSTFDAFQLISQFSHRADSLSSGDVLQSHFLTFKIRTLRNSNQLSGVRTPTVLLINAIFEKKS